MPDKLTDNEIIKAYEFCLKNKGCIGCIADKNSKSGEIDCKLKPQDIIDLFNRLQAENERLHKEVGYWEAETKEARADIDQAVAEAYKEFAEMVIAELDDRKQTVIGAREKILKKTNGFRNHMVCQLDSSVSHYMSTIDLIKTILKKLVGEKDD